MSHEAQHEAVMQAEDLPGRLNAVVLPPRDLHGERQALERITLARLRRDNPQRTFTVVAG